jgi:hypothetical protein
MNANTGLQQAAQISTPAVPNNGIQLGNYKLAMAMAFSGIFHAIALILVAVTLFQFLNTVIQPDGEVINAAVKSINTLVISLAMFELGVGISKEYVSDHGEGNVFFNIRRTITRFVGTVCIALVLEALIMIIKYSQLDLAGNLYYPVGILIGSSVLLSSLGLFLWLTQGHTE